MQINILPCTQSIYQNKNNWFIRITAKLPPFFNSLKVIKDFKGPNILTSYWGDMAFEKQPYGIKPCYNKDNQIPDNCPSYQYIPK